MFKCGRPGDRWWGCEAWDGNTAGLTLEEFPPQGIWSPNRNLIIPLYVYVIELKYFFNNRVSYWGGNPSSLFLCFHLCNENLYATVNSNLWTKHRQDSTLNPSFHTHWVTPAKGTAKIMCPQNCVCSLDSASASIPPKYTSITYLK
jgi:hypothetical protein